MKTLLIITLNILIQSKHSFTNTVWINKVANGCIDTLKFRSNNIVYDYSCEQQYKFRGRYKIVRDTLTITENDNSHDEDNQKTATFKTVFLIRKNALLIIGNSKLANKNCKNSAIRSGVNTVYTKINQISKTKI